MTIADKAIMQLRDEPAEDFRVAQAQLDEAKEFHAAFAKSVLVDIEQLHQTYGAEIRGLQAQIAQQEPK